MFARLRIDDLLAAQILSKQSPKQRARILGVLEMLREGTAPRSLLYTLVADGDLSLEEAQRTHTMIERYKLGRGLGVLVELFVQDAGLDREVVREHGRALGASADMNSLGRSLVAAGVVDAECECRLRFQARIALDRDLAKQVAAHCAAHGAVPDQKTLLETWRFQHAAQLPLVASGVFRMENPTPPPAESGEILQEHLTDADRESSAHGPGFRIPSDVDTTDLGPVMVGEYRILGRIASGRNTTIYLGRSFEDRRQAVAVKVLQRDASPDRVGRFKRGMVANGLFAHPRVVEVLDGGEAEGGEHYLVTEYHEGRTVRAILKDEGTLRPREALRVARQIVDALGAAHAAGVIHRDVRPKNILLSPDRREARLLDFGIALLSGSKFDDQVFHTLRPGLVGTAKYMSPEQAAGDQLEGSADFYSLGLTLYEMLAGASPFVAGTPMAYVNCHIVDDPKPLSEAAPATKRLPIALHELLDRLLEKDPDERMASAADVAGVIDFVVERLPSA